MGAFSNKDTVELHADWWEPHEVAVVRYRVKGADEEWVKNRQLLIEQENDRRFARGGIQREDSTTRIKNQTGAIRRLWVQRMLVSWTFTDDNGRPVRITDESMGELLQEYIDYIYEEIMKRQPDRQQVVKDGKDEGTPFISMPSSTTDGGISEPEENDQPDQSRNYLLKS